MRPRGTVLVPHPAANASRVYKHRFMPGELNPTATESWPGWTGAAFDVAESAVKVIAIRVPGPVAKMPGFKPGAIKVEDLAA